MIVRDFDRSNYQFLHFDSAFCKPVQTYDNSLNSFLDPFRAVFPMTIRGVGNIKRVYLKSVEMPIGFNNVRSGTNILKFTLSTGTSYTVTLAESNYTTIGNLLTALNSAVSTALTGSNVTMTFSAVGQKILIVFGGAQSVTSISFTETVFSKFILGIRINQGDLFDSVAKTYRTVNGSWNLNPDNYLNMYIASLNNQNPNMGGINCTFKVPVSVQTNQILFYEEADRQFVTVNDPVLRLSEISVQFFDRFGNNLTSAGLDYSFSLLLETLAT